MSSTLDEIDALLRLIRRRAANGTLQSDALIGERAHKAIGALEALRLRLGPSLLAHVDPSPEDRIKSMVPADQPWLVSMAGDAIVDLEWLEAEVGRAVIAERSACASVASLWAAAGRRLLDDGQHDAETLAAARAGELIEEEIRARSEP